MGRMMKATVHNGRATKGGLVYNANHNTKTETRDQEGHIDHSRTEQNINLQFTNEGRVRRCGSFDAKEFELSRYEHLYAKGQEAKNARYIQDGHPKRCKTVADIYESRRAAGRVSRTADQSRCHHYQESDQPSRECRGTSTGARGIYAKSWYLA